jgi:type VI secretion system secreted protein Hcp
MAAFDYFLKIDGIEGESRSALHKGEIDVESWSWGESRARPVGSGAGVGAGKVDMEDFSFSMQLSKASPKLFLACAEGNHIKAAWLTGHRATAGGKEVDYFLKWSFSDLLVSSYRTGAGADQAPGDQVTFGFAKIEVEYKLQKADGSFGETIKAGWDLKANHKL